MEAYGLEPQVVLTVAYLDSWDGTGMSASRGNYIGLAEAPEEQFGKAMRIPDELLEQWWTLIARAAGASRRPAGGEARARPLHRRPLLGRGPGPGGRGAFHAVVRRGEAPEDVPELALDGDDPVHLPKLIADGGLAASTSEARRLIGQGAVKLNGEAVSELDLPRAALAGSLLQVGKRRFARLTL